MAVIREMSESVRRQRSVQQVVDGLHMDWEINREKATGARRKLGIARLNFGQGLGVDTRLCEAVHYSISNFEDLALRRFLITYLP